MAALAAGRRGSDMRIEWTTTRPPPLLNERKKGQNDNASVSIFHDLFSARRDLHFGLVCSQRDRRNEPSSEHGSIACCSRKVRRQRGYRSRFSKAQLGRRSLILKSIGRKSF